MKSKILLTSLLFVVLLSACNNSEKPIDVIVPEKGGQINLGINDFNIDPLSYLGSEFPANNLNSILYRGLMKNNEKLQLTSDLAESITIDEEANKVEIILKDNIKWEDKTPITVEDVQFTYELYSNSSYNGYWKSYTFNILGTDLYRVKEEEHVMGIVISSKERSIIISYEDLMAKDLEFLTAPILSKQQLMEKPSIADIKELSFQGQLLTNGPFKIEKKYDSVLLLARNDAFEENVFLDKIIISNNVDKTSYDIMLGVPADIENEVFTSRDVLAIEGQAYEYLGMNLNAPEFSDLSTRKALASVINYSEIINNIYKGYAHKPLSPIHPQSWAYVANESYYGIEEAQAILTQKNLNLQLAYEDTILYQVMANQISNDLSEYGVNIELKPIPKNQYIPTLFYKGEFDLFLASWAYEYDPVYENEKWLAKNDVLENGYNVSHVNDEVSDNFLLNGGIVSIEEARLQHYTDWQNYFMSQYYIIPLASPQTIYLYKPDLHVNITNSLVPYVDIQNWWKEKTDK